MKDKVYVNIEQVAEESGNSVAKKLMGEVDDRMAISLSKYFSYGFCKDRKEEWEVHYNEFDEDELIRFVPLGFIIIKRNTKPVYLSKTQILNISKCLTSCAMADLSDSLIEEKKATQTLNSMEYNIYTKNAKKLKKQSDDRMDFSAKISNLLI